jgi:hypothetical protein
MYSSLSPFYAAEVVYRQNRVAADFSSARARRHHRRQTRLDRSSGRLASAVHRHATAQPR